MDSGKLVKSGQTSAGHDDVIMHFANNEKSVFLGSVAQLHNDFTIVTNLEKYWMSVLGFFPLLLVAAMTR